MHVKQWFDCVLVPEAHFHALLFVCVVLGKMRSAVGSAQLLMSQKFQQFRELCEENLVGMLSSQDMELTLLFCFAKNQKCEIINLSLS